MNQLVIMPDIEKRLEAFVRLGHGIIVFPGGVGTAEEILYLLGILLHPDNAALQFPLVLHRARRQRAAYFEQIDRFLRLTLGPRRRRQRYRIIVDDPARGRARRWSAGVRQGARAAPARRATPSSSTGCCASRASSSGPSSRPRGDGGARPASRTSRRTSCAANLRRAFSGIVAGNVKEEGMRLIEEHGPVRDPRRPGHHAALDALLRAFVDQRRMKLVGEYRPCYRIV